MISYLFKIVITIILLLLKNLSAKIYRDIKFKSIIFIYATNIYKKKNINSTIIINLN